MTKKLAKISGYAWIPIPILLIIIVFAKIAGINYANENSLLLLIFNLIFNTFASFLIIYLVSRSFLISGRISLVLFTCAALAWGSAGPLSGIFGNDDPNTTITIYNLSVFYSAILYFCGAFFWSRQKLSIKFPGVWLTLSIFFILILLTITTILAILGKTPVFFIEHRGGTPLRYFILITSIGLYVFTAIMVSISSKSLGLRSLYWYSVALGSLAIGLLGVMLQLRMGDFLNWTGRSAQFLGGIYMIIAAFALVRETKVWELSIEFDLNSKRQVAEEALRKSERRYRQIIELAGEGIIITDEKFKITEWNKAAELLYGWTSREVIGRNLNEILKSSVEEQKILKLLNDPSGIVQYETKSSRRDGTLLDVVVKLSAIRDDEGKVSGYIFINHDITERKQAEQQVKNAKDKIEHSQKRLDIALENAKIGLWEWDFQKNELLWDERTERMFGLNPGTFGKTLESFEELVHEEDIPRIRKSYMNSIEKGYPYESVFRIRSVENPRYISSRAFTVKNEDGHPQNMLGACFDVTSFREDTEKALIKLNQELSRSNSDLQNFAYVASHDLQEPLRMVTSFTQLLQMRYGSRLDEDAHTYIKYAVDGSKRMYELLNGLLEYSRISTRGRDFTVVDMNKVIDTVKSNLLLKLKERNAILNCESLPQIFADENQMIQIMQNLVDNAIKFSRNNPAITIATTEKDGFHIFSVSDKGIGIESQYFERIFRIFQRLHTREKFGGMGIGLSICQRIIERHGGRIWVESSPGNGSVFYFSIPENQNI